MGERFTVDVTFATPERQVLLTLEVDAGSTLGDVISESGIAQQFPGVDIDSLAAGVWGKVLPRDHRIKAGDRVELYRPLEMDPREARRKQADAGRTMGHSRDEP